MILLPKTRPKRSGDPGASTLTLLCIPISLLMFTNAQVLRQLRLSSKKTISTQEHQESQSPDRPSTYPHILLGPSTPEQRAL